MYALFRGIIPGNLIKITSSPEDRSIWIFLWPDEEFSKNPTRCFTKINSTIHVLELKEYDEDYFKIKCLINGKVMGWIRFYYSNNFVIL